MNLTGRLAALLRVAGRAAYAQAKSVALMHQEVFVESYEHIWRGALNRPLSFRVGLSHWFEGSRSGTSLHGDCPLPASSWARAISVETFTRASLFGFVALCSVPNLFWFLLFYFAFPNFLLVGRNVAIWFLANSLFTSSLIVLWIFGRLQIARWVHAHLDQPPGTPHAMPQGPVSKISWWILGVSQTQPFMLAVVTIWAGVFLFVADYWTGFVTEMRATFVILPLIPGSFGGGRDMLVASFFVVLIFAFLYPSLHQPATVLVINDHFALAVVNYAVFCISLFFVVALQGLSLLRIRQTYDDISSGALMLIRDVRTPIHGLMGILQEIEDEPQSNFPKESIDRIRVCVESMQSILRNSCLQAPYSDIADFVSHDRYAAGLGGLLRGENDVSVSAFPRQLQLLLDSFSRSRSQHGEVIWSNDETSVHEDAITRSLRIRLFGSAGNLLQALLNLIANACKFSKHGASVVVRLHLRRAENNPLHSSHRIGTHVFVAEVEDSGPGVPESERKAIFLPYVRASAAESAEGSGLGLAVVKECAGRLFGRVFCTDPVHGHGARFVLELPCNLIKTQIASDASPINNVPRVLPIDPQVVGQVALVDDNYLNLRILRTLLTKYGLADDQITSFLSAEAALDAMQRGQRFRLAFIDLVLPGIDGVELTRRIRTMFGDSGPIIVAATASATQRIVDEWDSAGAHYHMPKPFTSNNLHAMFRQVFAQHAFLSTPTEIPSEISGHLRHIRNPEVSISLLRASVTAIGVISYFSVLPVYAAGWRMLSFYLVGIGATAVFIQRNLKAVTIFGVHFSAMSLVLVSTLLLTFVGQLLNGCRNRHETVLTAVFAGLCGRVSIRWSLASACVGAVIVIFRAWVATSPNLCRRYMGDSDEFDLIADYIMMMFLVSVFLVQRSFFELARAARERWLHVLSHDIRAPLHEVVHGIGELRNIAPSEKLDIMQTCATSLLAALNTMLHLNSPYTFVAEHLGSSDNIGLNELETFINAYIVMLIGPDALDFHFNRKINVVGDTLQSLKTGHDIIRVARSPLLFAISKLLSLLPLVRANGPQLALNTSIFERESMPLLVIDIRGSGILNSRSKLEAESFWVAKEATSSIFERIEQLVFESMTPFFGQNEQHLIRAWCDPSRSAHASLLARAVRELLAGRLRFFSDDQTAEWHFALELPVRITTDLGAAADYSLDNIIILIADDNAMQLRLLERMLDSLGMPNHESFTDATSFVARVRSLVDGSNQIIACVDLHMPGISGASDWARKLGKLAAHRNLTIIAVTGETSSEVRDECHRHHFAGFLSKPFTAPDLRRALASSRESRFRPQPSNGC